MSSTNIDIFKVQSNTDATILKLEYCADENIEMIWDNIYQIWKIHVLNIMDLWIDLKNVEPEIAKRAVKNLMSFLSTYVCVKSLSLYAATKTK